MYDLCLHFTWRYSDLQTSEASKKKKKQTTHTTTLSEIPPQTKQNITKQNKKEKNEMTLKLQQIVCDERIKLHNNSIVSGKKKKKKIAKILFLTLKTKYNTNKATIDVFLKNLTNTLNSVLTKISA